MLLLASLAAAAVVDALPPGSRTAAVLVCPADDTCDASIALVEAALGEEPVVRLELLLELDNGGWSAGTDTRAAFGDALTRAREAAARGRWAAVAQATEEGHAALAHVRGDVGTQALFDIWFLDGAAALSRGEDQRHEYALRQAAAIADGRELALPARGEALERAWADERRKLVVGGAGTLTLGGDEGLRWSVDGEGVAPGVRELRLYPGTHRVVATRRGAVQSWRGDVPVLAGRAVQVSPSFGAPDDAAWMQAALERSFDTLQGPPELTARLSDWALRHDLEAVRLLRVETIEPPPPTPAAALGPRDPLRPTAADGERVDHGDGIPSTYTEEVVAEEEARRATRPASPERRLRVTWYDPALQRFTLDAPATTRADLEDPRFRVSLLLGYTAMMERHHAAVDVSGRWRLGPVDLDARLGVVRADHAYNVYADWVDTQLAHAALSARWAPRGRVAPYVAAGPELYVPAAFGARADAGLQVQVERHWQATIGGHAGWLAWGPSGGPTWGLAAGLGWAW